MEIYTEEEWFDEFYPKEWGNWREYYNIRAYREAGYRKVSGCSWMDYTNSGYLSTEDHNTGLMQVHQWNNGTRPNVIDVFFIEDNGGVQMSPYYQPNTGKEYVKVVVEKQESNLDLYSIYIAGGDDSSYTKHFIGTADLAQGIADVKKNSTSCIANEYFFTN